jgi:hypothetical protein
MTALLIWASRLSLMVNFFFLLKTFLGEASIKPAALGGGIPYALWSPSPPWVQLTSSKPSTPHMMVSPPPTRDTKQGGTSRFWGDHQNLCVPGALLDHSLAGARVITEMSFRRSSKYSQLANPPQSCCRYKKNFSPSSLVTITLDCCP